MTLNISKYNSFFEFTKKKIQTIIIPCFLMNISIFLIQSIVFEPQNILKMDIVHFIKALVIADRLHVYFQLWFLYALF